MTPGPLAAVDPRAKLAAFLAIQALLFLPSPRPPHARLLGVAVPLLALLALSRGAWRRWLRLLAISAPLLAFLVFSAFLGQAAGAVAARLGLLLAAKSALVLLSLALFVLSEKPGRLLQALRQCGLPSQAGAIMAIGLRFSGQWHLELEALRRAWSGRNASALPLLRRARLAGRMLPLFFERLFAGAVHVHDAMVGRGFRGELPPWRRLAFTGRDAAFLALTALAAALAHILP
jgi:energy-coupling factor transporter transmembrane protein EcfT